MKELKNHGIKSTDDRGQRTYHLPVPRCFSNEPWNDDWSDTEQLNAYISDLTGQSCSLTLGYFDGDRMVALSMGYIKHAIIEIMDMIHKAGFC